MEEANSRDIDVNLELSMPDGFEVSHSDGNYNQNSFRITYNPDMQQTGNVLMQLPCSNGGPVRNVVTPLTANCRQNYFINSQYRPRQVGQSGYRRQQQAQQCLQPQEGFSQMSGQGSSPPQNMSQGIPQRMPQGQNVQTRQQQQQMTDWRQDGSMAVGAALDVSQDISQVPPFNRPCFKPPQFGLPCFPVPPPPWTDPCSPPPPPDRKDCCCRPVCCAPGIISSFEPFDMCCGQNDQVEDPCGPCPPCPNDPAYSDKVPSGRGVASGTMAALPSNSPLNKADSHLPFIYEWDKCSDTVRITGKPRHPDDEVLPSCPEPPPREDDTQVTYNSNINVTRSVPIIKKNPYVKRIFPDPYLECGPYAPAGSPPPPEQQDNLMRKMIDTVGPSGQFDPRRLDLAEWLTQDRATVKVKYSQVKPFGFNPDTGEVDPPGKVTRCINSCGEIYEFITPPDPFRENAWKSLCMQKKTGVKVGDIGLSRADELQSMFADKQGVELSALANDCPDRTSFRQFCGRDLLPGTPYVNVNTQPVYNPCCDPCAFATLPDPGPATGYASKPTVTAAVPDVDSQLPDSLTSNRSLMDLAFFFYVWLFCVAISQLFKVLYQSGLGQYAQSFPIEDDGLLEK